MRRLPTRMETLRLDWVRAADRAAKACGALQAARDAEAAAERDWLKAQELAHAACRLFNAEAAREHVPNGDANAR